MVYSQCSVHRLSKASLKQEKPTGAPNTFPHGSDLNSRYILKIGSHNVNVATAIMIAALIYSRFSSEDTIGSGDMLKFSFIQLNVEAQHE